MNEVDYMRFRNRIRLWFWIMGVGVLGGLGGLTVVGSGLSQIRETKESITAMQAQLVSIEARIERIQSDTETINDNVDYVHRTITEHSAILDVNVEKSKTIQASLVQLVERAATARDSLDKIENHLHPK